jgi:S1-C subfamily serine protease
MARYKGVARMLRPLILILALVIGDPAYGRATGLADADVAQRAMAAVVTFSIWKMRPPATEGEVPRRVKTYVSGFVIDARGIIVTNKHVVEDAVDIMVILNDGTRTHGSLIATAAVTDLALVKISAATPLSD